MVSFSDMFEQAVDDGYGPDVELTPGKYQARIKFSKVGTTKNSGDPSIGFVFEALSGKSDSGEDMTGAVRWFNLYFTPAAMNFAVRDAKKLGLTPAMLDTDMEAAAKTVIGQVWNVTVKKSKDGKNTNLYLDSRLDDVAADAVAAPSGTWEI